MKAPLDDPFGGHPLPVAIKIIKPDKGSGAIDEGEETTLQWIFVVLTAAGRGRSVETIPKI